MYLSRLREIVDLDVIKKAGVKIAFDPMWGAARGYSDAFLREAGITVATVHDTRDVLFGGHAPEPDDHLLEDLRARCAKWARLLASRPMAMPIASALSTKTARSSSPTTSSRCSSITWSKRAAGRTESANP